MKQKNIQTIQALRGIACVAIVLFHLPSEWGGIKANYSALPLTVFFMLTGYFLLEGTRKTEKDYFKKKAVRIIPLYWSLTLLIFAVSFVMPGINHGRNYTVEDLIKSLLFIPYYNSDGNLFPILSVGWTLIIEVYDYIIFWAVYRFLRRFKYRDVLALLIMSGLIIFGCVLKSYLHNSPILDIWTNKYQLSFILGLFLSCLKQCEGTSEKKYIVTWPYILIGFAVVFYILCYRIPDNYAWISAFVLVAASVSIFKEIEFPQWSVYLGNISYSVYLIHKFVIAVAEKIVAHVSVTPITVFAGVIFVFVVTIAAATVSYNLIEKRFGGFLKHIMGF